MLSKTMPGSRWHITYTFDPPIPHVGGELVFPDQELALMVTNGVLTGLSHHVQTLETLDEESAIALSRSRLEAFLAAIRFLQFKPLRMRTHAIRLLPPEPGGRLRIGGSATITTGPRPITTPSVGWQGGTGRQLSAWLQFAAQAQESTSAASALRLYFLIFEDMEASSDEMESTVREVMPTLKALRDFVSHAKIGNARTRAELTRISEVLGSGPDAYRYNPANVEQTAILTRWRWKISNIIDRVLMARLGIVSETAKPAV